ncbi:MAG: PAS domain S-box protein [Pseudomonadota bacterium]
MSSAKVHRRMALPGKLDVLAEEMRLLTSSLAVVVTIFLPEFIALNEVRSVVMSPYDTRIAPDQRPALTLPLKDEFNKEFGQVDIYTMGGEALDAPTEQIAHMFVGTSAFTISQMRDLQSSFAPDQIFRQMVEMAHEGIWMLDRTNKVTYLNQAMADMLGYDRTDLIGGHAFAVFTADDSEVSRKIMEAGLVGKLGPREISMRRKDGSLLWCHLSASQVLDEAGELQGHLGVVVDITKRKNVEDALRGKQAALETALDVNSNIIDSAFDVVCVIDVIGRIVSVSRRVRDAFGYEPDDLVGLHFRDFLRPECVEGTEALMNEVRLGREPPKPFDFEIMAKDGHPVEVSGSLSWNGRHQLLFVFMHDMTEQRELEARLRQAQRLEAVGQLTGGVAHDFNNLLTVILGNAEALSDKLGDNQGLKALADMTRKAAERGADLTNRLLSFARKQALEPKPADVNALVANMDGMMRRMIDDDIEIEFRPNPSIARALVDASQLEAAILNIAVNARDAMPSGGRFCISTASAYLDADNADLPVEVKSGAYVLISLRDSGAGMDTATLARVFEPFFTTKPVGVGSGLGLSMVYGFVRQSGGHITIESASGHGTSVNLYLPVCVNAVAEDASPVPEPEAVEPGHELILLVEDNELVRSFVESQLESLGYRVISVENGNKALDVLREEKNIDLLFTDVVMPGGLNGRQLAEEARKLRSNIKVLFTSGYSEDAIIHDGRLDEGVQLLSKPYKRRDLADKVRLVLEAGEKV